MLALPYYPGLYTAPRHHLPRYHDTLEVTGPVEGKTPEVNYSPSHFAPDTSGPTYAKEKPGWEIEWDTAHRMHQLLKTLNGSTPQAIRAVEELKWRLLILHPHAADVL